jgi:cell division protein FtsN
MTARRGKSQARRTGSSGLPGWAWLLIGVVLTLLTILLVPRYLKSGNGHDFFRPTPNPNALPPAVSSEDDAIAPDIAPAPEKPKPQYDFYTLLPGQEVAMSDAELAQRARAEAAAEHPASPPAATPPQPGIGDTLPAPVTTAPATPPTTPPATTPARPDAATAATTPEPAPAHPTHYVLQAGAFAASGDAEALKAKIALLGLSARVESAQIDGKTVFRVRLGPYGNASELAAVKAKLAENGLPAAAIRSE